MYVVFEKKSNKRSRKECCNLNCRYTQKTLRNVDLIRSVESGIV